MHTSLLGSYSSLPEIFTRAGMRPDCCASCTSACAQSKALDRHKENACGRQNTALDMSQNSSLRREAKHWRVGGSHGEAAHLIQRQVLHAAHQALTLPDVRQCEVRWSAVLLHSEDRPTQEPGRALWHLWRTLMCWISRSLCSITTSGVCRGVTQLVMVK